MSEATSAEPSFSVVIAAYNAASWIVATVRSALAQTRPAHEIIVVGDCCTDETGAIIASNFGERVQWRNLDANTGGQSFPNNEGIRLARGTYVAYLGHDDIWSPRHLERLAELVRAHDPDFAVSGAVFHGPPGSRFYQITGLFEDPRAAAEEFFPPSSIAHRREITDRIGAWRAPDQLRAPADCEFLLRAAEAKCTFASTRAITVHKFAAGHRYLSYRRPSGEEQRVMLERLSTPEGEATVLREVENDIAAGADHPPIRYAGFDAFSGFAAGELYRRNRKAKGLESAPPMVVNGPCCLMPERGTLVLDWYDVEAHPLQGPFRWSGPNPNPRYLINVKMAGDFALRIHALAFADGTLVRALRLDIDDREMPIASVRDARTGAYAVTTAPIAGPVDNGVVLRFRMPYCARPPQEPKGRRVGLALGAIEVLPLTSDKG
jgi:hypothetical protein